MIRLTPLRETAGFQEAMKEKQVDLLMLMINDKFSLSDELNKGLRADLETSTMDTLQTLFTQILHIDGLEQLERWITGHHPTHAQLANIVMIRLTPFAETISGRELIKNERVAMMTMLVQDKFTLPNEQIETIRADLEKLELEELKLLVQHILHFDTLDALEQWIAEHQPRTPA